MMLKYNEFINEKLILGKKASKMLQGSSELSQKIKATYIQLIKYFGEPEKEMNSKFLYKWHVYDKKENIAFSISDDYRNTTVDWEKDDEFWLVYGDTKKTYKIIDYIENLIK